MLKCYGEEAFDYIHTVVERFILLFEDLACVVEDLVFVDESTPILLEWIKDEAKESLDEAKESLSALVNQDDNLSQDPSSEVPNIRILTTKGDIDIYFFVDASDENIPYAQVVDFDPKPKKGYSCLLFSVNGVYIDYYHFDLHCYSHVIEDVAPQFSIMIYNAIYSEK